MSIQIIYRDWDLQDSVYMIFSKALLGAQMGSALTARAVVSAPFFLVHEGTVYTLAIKAIMIHKVTIS